MSKPKLPAAVSRYFAKLARAVPREVRSAGARKAWSSMNDEQRAAKVAALTAGRKAAKLRKEGKQ